MRKKIVRKKKKSPSSALLLARQANQITALTAQMANLVQLVHALNIQVAEVKFQRPPEERIRVVTQKTIEEPKTGFEKTLNWTTNQVNQHLNSLGETDMQDIIQSALTGKEVPNSKSSPMTDYLNSNYGTIVNQKDVWDTIADAKQDATARIAARTINDVDLVAVKKALELMKEVGKIQ